MQHDEVEGPSHARGELIAVECAIDRCERAYESVPPRLLGRDVALRRTYEEEWNRPLKPYMANGHFKRGFIETVTLRPYSEPAVCLNALRGLTPVRWLSVDASGVRVDFARDLGVLGTSPVMRRIEGIRLQGVDVLPLLPDDAFVALSQLAHLRWLVLPDHRLSAREVASFGDVPFSRLEVLDLSNEPGVDARSVSALLESPYLAGLRHLGVSSRCRDRVRLRRADTIARAFARATHLERLERLTLPNGLTDDGVRALSRVTHFGELRELRLEAPALHNGYDVLRTEASWMDGLMKLEIDRNDLGEPMTALANAGLARLLRSGRLAGLRYLTIDHDVTEDVARAIAALPSLRVLRLPR